MTVYYRIFPLAWILMLAVVHEAQARGWYPHAGFTKAMGYSAVVAGLLAFFIMCSFLPKKKNPSPDDVTARPRLRRRPRKGAVPVRKSLGGVRNLY